MPYNGARGSNDATGQTPDQPRAHCESHVMCRRVNLTYPDKAQLRQPLCLRKETYLTGVIRNYPELSTFFPLLIDEFLRPIWCGVNHKLRSQTAVLPELCSFPIIPVPHEFFGAGTPATGFFLGRTYSGLWTVVDFNLVTNPAAARSPPRRLLHMLVLLNSASKASSSAVVAFDANSGKVRLIDVNFADDKIVITDVCDNSGAAPYLNPRELPHIAPGAVCISGLYDGKVIFTIGSDIHVLNQDGASWSIKNALKPPVSTGGIPISTQSVAPFLDSEGRLFFLTDGSLYVGCSSGTMELLYSQNGVAYISLVFDSKSDILVLLGFSRNGMRDKCYISLFNTAGRFIVGSTVISDVHPSSIVSCSVDTFTSEIFVVGRNVKYGRYGSLCFSVPAIYN
jgi:hypothetical protein